MPRNLERRVEILFPVENDKLRAKLWHILDMELNDTDKAHVMNEKGVYIKCDAKKLDSSDRVNSQKIFGDEASRIFSGMDSRNTRVFIPEMRV